MRRIAIALITVFLADTAGACTTFCTRGLFGRNYDFEIGDGMVVVNKRGMRKQSQTATPASWTSRYGSVTFNQFGRDTPTGGMNQQGLVVELMWLDGTRYPAADTRPSVGTLEWIQWQLDNSATVADVIAGNKAVRISERGVPLHYLVADASGDVASVEFLDGKTVIHRGESLPVPALANDPYAQSLRNPDNRFALAASGVKNVTSIDAAFALLARVAQQHTQWSIVYDIRNRAVHWRTAANAERRSLKFAALDFTCATPPRVADIDAGRGDMLPQLRDYTPAQNLALVRRSMRGTSFLRDTTDAEIEEAAHWPERSTCAK